MAELLSNAREMPVIGIITSLTPVLDDMYCCISLIILVIIFLLYFTVVYSRKVDFGQSCKRTPVTVCACGMQVGEVAS